MTLLFNIDKITLNSIRGWVFDDSNPSFLKIGVKLNNRKIGQVDCNLYRKDLQEKYGKSSYFHLNLPDNLTFKINDILNFYVLETNYTFTSIKIDKIIYLLIKYDIDDSDGHLFQKILKNNLKRDEVICVTNNDFIPPIKVQNSGGKNLVVNHLFRVQNRPNCISLNYTFSNRYAITLLDYVLRNPSDEIVVHEYDLTVILILFLYISIWDCKYSFKKEFIKIRELIDSDLFLSNAVFSNSAKDVFEIIKNIKINDSFLNEIVSNDNKYYTPKNILDLEEYYSLAASGFFDPVWYKNKYKIKSDCLSHYISVGWKKNNPSKLFDTKAYLLANPDIKEAGVNPLVHYVLTGRYENRSLHPKPYQAEYMINDPKYVGMISDKEKINSEINVIAWYLPQFHAIKENDHWWGKGFTEWTNVRPAQPNFDGHYQPHIPDEYLGYYNLLSSEVLKKQIELAKIYGITGFCFYLYWFDGKKLLDKPLEKILDDKSLNIPFCLCWANENWSRRWDGRDDDLLIAQNHTNDDDIDFIKYVSRFFVDSRYIRVNGKPLLMIYRPNLFPNIRETVLRWREWCRKNGVGEIYLVYPQSFEMVDPINYGFDAATEFPPNNSNPPNITEVVPNKNKKFEGTIYDWQVFLRRSYNYINPSYTLFRSLCPSWDNTARRKNKGTIFLNSCPALFEKWAINAFRYTLTQQKYGERFVFVNAWNEWAEGCHLEPDQKYGFAWLDAIRNAHLEVKKSKSKILLVTHDAHPHGAQLLVLHLAKNLTNFFNFEVHIACLGPGVLISEYQKYGYVHEVKLDSDDLLEVRKNLISLMNENSTIAIVNTTVSGKITPLLHELGYRIISLVHELPEILKTYKLKDAANNIYKYSLKIVFAADVVRRGFFKFIGQSQSNNCEIRPQGLYLPSVLRKGASKEDIKSRIFNSLGLSKDSKLILCAGYADKRKGFDLFVNIYIKVMREIPEAHAIWVGHLDQEFVDEVLAKIDKSMRSKFIFTGRVESPQEYYVAADVYALTSREDPFPSVVMEALDAMTPVVGFSGVGGFEDLLKRDCGILVPFGNTDQFAKEIVTLLQDFGKSKKLASKGREIIGREFSFTNYIYDLLKYVDHPIRRISVVIPNYNYAQYIIERISNVLNQTYPVYELIILDDASSDNSVELIQEFLKTLELPHKLLINEKNSGSVYEQWYKGVREAEGDLVWIAEADDLADPDFLATLVDCFKDREVNLAYTQSKQIDENGKIIAKDYLAYTNDIGSYWNANYIVEGELEISRALCVKNTIPNVSGVIFQKDTLLKVFSKNLDDVKKYKVAGDWYLYIQLLTQGKIAFHSRSLNLHRRHSSSVTKQNNHLDEILNIHNFIMKNHEIDENIKIKIFNYQKFLNNYFGLIKK